MVAQGTLAGGCFWCIEAVYRLVRGVNSVVSGYCGGHTDNPTYEQIHRESTGHAEAIQIDFDDSIVSYEELLKIFYYIHDPTTLNRQGNDVGEEYRSVIFYHDQKQKEVAKDVTKKFAAKLWNDPVVTEVIPLEKFWPAENYHQDYFANNPEQMYCQVIINPKLEKFKSKFESYLK